MRDKTPVNPNGGPGTSGIDISSLTPSADTIAQTDAFGFQQRLIEGQQVVDVVGVSAFLREPRRKPMRCRATSPSGSTGRSA